MSPGLAAVAGSARQLREDARWTGHYVVFSTLGGSMWIPRVLRRLLFVLAGASMQSSPGPRSIFAGHPRNLTVGREVYLNRGVFIEANAPVTVGDECALGMEVMILTSHHPLDRFGTWSSSAEGRPVVIGDRVWIGARAVILPGAVIDSDVVIPAAAFVAGHCRSHGLYAGVPARRIRDFDEVGS